MLKALSFLRYSNFCLGILIVYENGLMRKSRLISKFMTSQAAQQVNTMYILPNIPRSKVNQKVKFGQLIDYGMGILKNHAQIVLKKLVPNPFVKNQN